MSTTMKGFILIIIGLIMTFFDFSINGVNLIPDLVGFILIAIGLSLHTTWDSSFNTARIMAFLLVFLAIPDLFEFTIPITPGPIQIFLTVLWPLNIVRTIVFILMNWFLFRGISAVAISQGNERLASSAMNCLWSVIIVSSISTIFSSFSTIFMILLGFSLLLLLMSLVITTMFILGFLVLIYQLYVLYRADQELGIYGA